MAKHYRVKGKSRLTTRETGEPDYKWLRTISQIGALVNDWARRGDLVVYGGDDSAEGEAIAAYYADISEIEINLREAFGAIGDPEEIGDIRELDTQRTYPMVTGVLFHEALHARHTNWDTDQLAETLDNSEGQAFMLLEESRIEAKGMREKPELRQFLRTSALDHALQEATPDNLAKLGSDTWAVANLLGLSVARHDSGVLAREDVANIYRMGESVLGAELLNNLRAVWREFQTLGVPQVERAIELAKVWVALLREADPEGEPDSGNAFAEPQEGEGEGKGEGSPQPSEAVQKMLDEMEKSAESSQSSAEREMAEQKQQQDWSDIAKQRAEQAKNRNQKREQAKKTFDKSHSESGSGSGSRIEERRNPTGAERASAVSIAKSLEKAKYRERSVHTRKTQAPMGKLVMRNAIQNKAMEANGLRGDLPSWKSKTRKHTDDPTLTLGVMVDISGSMSSAMESMGQTAWIMSEAGRRIQAKTAMVYYGSGVFPTLRVGQRLDQVTIYTAPDGTEKFGEAWEALDGELGLTYGDGVRMLVIVSDGYYTPAQQEKCVTALRECKQNGVAVLWLVPKECYGHPAKNLTAQAGWGVVADELDVSQIATLVGKTASESLSRVESMSA